MNRRTVERFQRYKPAEIVMWCPSCVYFYDEIQRFSWPVPVRHATDFRATRLAELEFTGRVEAGAALHYRSQSEPRRQEGAAARRLPEAVPGLRFVEIGSEPQLGRLGPPRHRRRSASRSGTRGSATRSPGRGRAAPRSWRRSIAGASG